MFGKEETIKSPALTWEVSEEAPRLLKQAATAAGMLVNKDIDNRVYFAHSPHIDFAKVIQYDRCTVAVKKVDNDFIYGLAICSHMDGFVKAKGRELAEKRMNDDFSKVDASNYKHEGETWERAIIRFANELVINAVRKPSRFKRKICSNCGKK